MNGREIENLLTQIDANIVVGRSVLRAEIMAYLKNHEDMVLTALRSNDQQVSVPTSSGVFKIDLAELEALVA